jgi:hypothetical protein
VLKESTATLHITQIDRLALIVMVPFHVTGTKMLLLPVLSTARCDVLHLKWSSL